MDGAIADVALDASVEIRAALQADDQRLVFRIWLTYNDTLDHPDAAELVPMVSTPPVATGSDLDDAAIAAVTEYWIGAGSDLPRWVEDSPVMEPPRILADSATSGRSTRRPCRRPSGAEVC